MMNSYIGVIAGIGEKSFFCRCLIQEDRTMVKSMTGFGRAEASVDGLTVIAEIRSVKHRFFDFSLRCPKNCQFLENEIKQEVR